MTAEKDVENSMSPMFPRLHLHDSEKGGSRGPSRNRMALYEHPSVSSQRFNSGSSTFLSLPSNNGNGRSLVNSTTYPSHGVSNERTMFSSFNNSPRLLEMNLPYSSTDIPSYASIPSFQSSHMAKTLALVDIYNPFQLNNISSYKKLSLEKGDDVGDYKPPIFSQSRSSYLNCSQQNSLRGKNSYPLSSCSLQLKPPCDKQMKGTDITELSSMQRVKSQFQKDEEFSQNAVSFSLFRDNILEGSSSAQPAKGPSSMSLKRKYIALNQESESSSHDKISHLHDASAHMDKESLPFKMVFGDEKNKETRNDIDAGTGLFSREGDNKTFNGLDNPTKFGALKKYMQIGDCITDSAVAIDICSDDAVKLLGEKHFWKARSTIVNQQRTLTSQIFELHKLITVQRKLAESPQLFVEGTSSVTKDNPKNMSQKDNFTNNNADENSFEKLSLPSVGKDHEQTTTRDSNKGMCPRTVLDSPVPPIAKSSSWSFPPPGSQWLVPFVSPTEGLVYKPYTGPYPPPPAGFLASFYGTHGSMNLTGKSEDYPNAAIGIAAPHQGIGILTGATAFGHSYFPPYGLPVMNSSISSSKPEQLHPFPKPQAKICDINLNLPHPSPYKMLDHISLTNSLSDTKFQASKESELQGIPESSPLDREKPCGLINLFPTTPTREIADGLPLFPTVPTLQGCNQNAQSHKSEPQTEVIKVVPHDPISASKSAVRIYQSIQAERKKL